MNDSLKGLDQVPDPDIIWRSWIFIGREIMAGAAAEEEEEERV